ncbi:fimbrial protein [Aquitalea sp. ASV15]|uniref:fimbrial protein n=1 Tax=Aquitalea sp. ASV15 TaxID=2795104 RepID=UPI0018EE43CB|nr:fimbrial protein [Aquitalea sp. ASV15]
MKNLLKHISSAGLLICSNHVFATVKCVSSYTGDSSNVTAPVVSPPINASIPGFSWSGAANSLTVGTSFTSWQTADNIYSVFTCTQGKLDGAPYPATYIAPAIPPISGMFYTLNGVTYSIFPTKAPGIGYIVGAADPAKSYTPLGFSPNFMLNGQGYVGMGLKYFIQFVITGSLKTGTYIIPAQTVANIQLRDETNSAAYAFNLNLASTTISIKASTCTANTGNLNITLPSVNSINLASIGSLSLPTPFSISLSCPSSLNVYMTFTDNNNPSNTSNLLSLKSSSTASGIGVQIKKADGSLVKFGPDSANKGTTNQFLLMNNMTGNQVFPFSAYIVRTGNMMPGSLAAIATFTFSYQ